MDGSAEFMEALPPTNDGLRLPQVHYINSDHLGSAFAAMNLMRQSNQLCDISLEVLDNSTPAIEPTGPASPVSPTAPVRQVRAHKVVLAAASAYFNAMFNSEYDLEVLSSHIRSHFSQTFVLYFFQIQFNLNSLKR